MFEGWVFCEKSTGECYMVDGASDEGEGDVIVHTRVGRTRFGSVESEFEEDFRRLMLTDFMFVGQGQAALMYVHSIMDTKGIVPRNKRHVDRLQRACARHVETLRDTRWRYRVDKIGETYNGNGKKGSGGPPADLLRAA